MSKLFVPILALGLIAATAAMAQSSGGHGRGGRGGQQPSSSAPPPSTPAAPPTPPKPENQIEIVGVIKAVDRDAGRITIAYEAVEALGWPRGTMPFAVGKTALLKGATVGEKVRFRLESQQIVDLRPF